MDNTLTENFTPYAKRSIRFTGLQQLKDWQIKRYWISWQNEKADSDLTNQLTSMIDDRLSKLDHGLTHYQVGFGIVHQGKDGVYFIFSHWVEENMLDHMVYVPDSASEKGYKRIEPDTIISCIWE
ncbi:MAG: hypothetical protein WBA74_16790, partial [Cyclobacteriaceae bacterium]